MSLVATVEKQGNPGMNERCRIEMLDWWVPELGCINTALAPSLSLSLSFPVATFSTLSILWPGAAMFYEAEPKKWRTGLAEVQSGLAYLLNLLPGLRTFNSHVMMSFCTWGQLPLQRLKHLFFISIFLDFIRFPWNLNKAFAMNSQLLKPPLKHHKSTSSGLILPSSLAPKCLIHSFFSLTWYFLLLCLRYFLLLNLEREVSGPQHQNLSS